MSYVQFDFTLIWVRLLDLTEEDAMIVGTYLWIWFNKFGPFQQFQSWSVWNLFVVTTNPIINALPCDISTWWRVSMAALDRRCLKSRDKMAPSVEV